MEDLRFLVVSDPLVEIQSEESVLNLPKVPTGLTDQKLGFK